MSFKKKLAGGVGGVLVLFTATSAAAFWNYVLRTPPVKYAEDPTEHFKYDSVGLEAAGLPLYIWEVMPEVCTGAIPGDNYASLGFFVEPGHALPIGVTTKTIGVERVAINCAACHTGTYRTAPDAPRQMILGAPTTLVEIDDYQRFFVRCGEDARFTADNVMTAIEKRHPLSAADAFVYRYVMYPAVKKGLAEKGAFFAPFDHRPAFGPGRIDIIGFKSTYKYDVSNEKIVGNADVPSLWNQGPREGMYGQWTGDTNSLKERNLIAAIGVGGTTPDAIDIPSLDRVEAFAKQLPPPKFPFPTDAALVAAGEPIYQAKCASCHAFGGAKMGEITPIEDLKTDRGRLDGFSPDLVAKVNETRGPGWAIKNFRKTNGYINQPLDGLWARAPYLHNGSVATMRDLLEPPEKRAAVFYRGYDVYDPKDGGFVSSGPEAEKVGWKLDTAVTGNGNGGHLYGIELSADEKNALVEYMKTL